LEDYGTLVDMSTRFSLPELRLVVRRHGDLLRDSSAAGMPAV
jgi:hypothetical protein